MTVNLHNIWRTFRGAKNRLRFSCKKRGAVYDLIAKGWSRNVLVQDLAAIDTRYASRKSGAPPRVLSGLAAYSSAVSNCASGYSAVTGNSTGQEFPASANAVARQFPVTPRSPVLFCFEVWPFCVPSQFRNDHVCSRRPQAFRLDLRCPPSTNSSIPVTNWGRRGACRLKTRANRFACPSADKRRECRWPQQTEWELSSLYKCSLSSSAS
jgi:hypothetical protein